MQLAELTVQGFADLLGSDAPAPGGGGAPAPGGGRGATSLIIVTSRPTACSARIAASRP